MNDNELDEWIARELPPRPDPVTGEPRPPASNQHSPSRGIWSRGGTAPPPPPGRGQALEWGVRIPWQFVISLALIVGSTAFFVWSYLIEPETWLDRGLLISMLIWGAVVFVGTQHSIQDHVTRVAVGADWLRVGHSRWVDLYALERVQLRGSLRTGIYVFQDSSGRTVRVGGSFLEMWALRDLVVNGIQHSWHRGAQVDPALRQDIGLDDGPAGRRRDRDR